MSSNYAIPDGSNLVVGKEYDPTKSTSKSLQPKLKEEDAENSPDMTLNQMVDFLSVSEGTLTKQLSACTEAHKAFEKEIQALENEIIKTKQIQEPVKQALTKTKGASDELIGKQTEINKSILHA